MINISQHFVNQKLNKLMLFIEFLYSSLNRHLIVVEEFEYPNDLRSYVVRGLMPLVGSPKANRS